MYYSRDGGFGFDQGHFKIGNPAACGAISPLLGVLPSRGLDRENVFFPRPQIRHMNKKYPSKLPTPAPPFATHRPLILAF